MGARLQTAINRNKKKFIIVVILWLFIAIVFVAPLAFSIVEASQAGSFDFAIFLEQFGANIVNFSSIGKVFSDKYISMYLKVLGGSSLLYLGFVILGFVKSVPKHEYADIEHGSSSWCEGGEQYKILSKDKGILLAEKHFLPVTKRGNINVLVVGRFWFW